MANRIKLKRGLSSKISSAVLEEGEIALTVDTNKLYSKNGEINPNNVYIGTSEPSSNNIECWINPNASFDPTAYFDKIYPVGSLYMSVNSTDPSQLFGGTWTKIEGSFLWGTSNTPKHSGGSKTTDSTVLTVDQIPKHTHKMRVVKDNDTNSGGQLPKANNSQGNNNGWSAYCSDIGNYAIENTGGDQGHTHTFMPPYFEVYMWYRIK